MKMRPNGLQSQSGWFGEEKDLYSLSEFEWQCLGSAVHSLATTLTQLTRLFCTKVFSKNVLHKPFENTTDWRRHHESSDLLLECLNGTYWHTVSWWPPTTRTMLQMQKYVMRNVVTCVQFNWLDSRHRDRTIRIRSVPGHSACIWNGWSSNRLCPDVHFSSSSSVSRKIHGRCNFPQL
jgi:hypothetical protein